VVDEVLEAAVVEAELVVDVEEQEERQGGLVVDVGEQEERREVLLVRSCGGDWLDVKKGCLKTDK